MKKLTLSLIGILPFFIGYFMNYLMMGPFYDKVLPYKLIGVLFLILWLLIGRYSYKFVLNIKESVFIGNVIPFLVLLLVLFQEIILHQYWDNHIGIAGQFYYIALAGFASSFTRLFSTMSATYIVSFLMMSAVYYLGCRTRKNHTK